MSKPRKVMYDNDLLNNKVYLHNLKRMKRNKYFKKGYDALKKEKKNEHDNPYKLPPDVVKLLTKRTFWFIGWDEADKTIGSKQRHKELEKLRRKNRHAKHKHKHK